MSDFVSSYAHLRDDELLQLWAERSQLVGEAQTTLRQEIQKRGITEDSDWIPRRETAALQVSQGQPSDRTPEEWAKRRKQFRWVWFAFGAFIAVVVILSRTCGK